VSLLCSSIQREGGGADGSSADWLENKQTKEALAKYL
jgi:hypothetical protein